jgi:hypothetical protein
MCSALPTLGGLLNKVTAKPSALRRIKIADALRVIDLIDDPMLLADILDVDKRSAIRDAITRHHLYPAIPHERICARCRDNELLETTGAEDLATLLRDRLRRDPRVAGKNLCHHQVMATLRAQPVDAQPALWATAVDGLLSGAGVVRVAIAAGRTPLDPELALGDVRSGTRDWLDREPVATPNLLRLAVLCSHIPTHWSLTEQDWIDVCRQAPFNAVTSLRPPLTSVLAAWDAIWADLHVWTLRFPQTLEELQDVLARIRETRAASEETDLRRASAIGTRPISAVDSRRVDIFALLARYPELSDLDRITMLSLTNARSIGEYLCGRYLVKPRVSEIPQLVDLYLTAARSKDGAYLVSLLATLDTDDDTPEQRRLVEEALQRCTAAKVFSFEGPLANAGHAYVWSRIASPGAIQTLVGLLAEWTGTLHELVDTVLALEVAPLPSARSADDRTL